MTFSAGFGSNDAVLPIGLVSGLVELAQQQQLDIDKLLRGSRLFYQDLADPQRKITPAQWLLIIERLSKLHAEPDALALLYGQQQALNHHSLVTSLWSSAAHLAQALRLMQKLLPLLQPLVMLRVRQRQDELVLQLQPSFGLGAQQRFIFSAMLSAIRTLLRQQLGADLQLQIDLPWAAAEWQPHFHAALGSQLLFDTPCCAIYLKRECLFMPFVEAAPLRRQQLLTSAQLALADRPIRESLQSQLRRLVRRQLNSGIALERAAAYLQCSPATLKRRLKQDGVSFQQLLDEVRRDEVLLRLYIYGYSNRQLAECLNINDMHNFRRLFKRWTGMVPNSFR
ncbi:AraC family transcriptional regulator ligand-binding domain-containing protein [Shewanella avicenniae]|uniref:AraC family transcriptional regulator ligand-binding domain-containing protein n=1 Tax=Shewanella avicenniae TaxID=2814294 RepID=A0ABX7QTK7_9GAMM|nr:AraC family transcriptional regulator [Shewanella avicenniae]QSX34245.1 AraC family transcriptional regulator ligand-binding domain-containing protein [Shewanella avicenniae]